MDVLSLLRSKNRCLQRYLDLSVEFEDACENGGSLDGLAAFEQAREAILKAINLYERKIAEAAALIRPADRTPAMIEEVKALLAQKEVLVHRILALDLKIIGRIEEARSALLKEMSGARKGKDAIAKFKSGWVAESGEELDTKL
jgi:hypothetical protein